MDDEGGEGSQKVPGAGGGRLTGDRDGHKRAERESYKGRQTGGANHANFETVQDQLSTNRGGVSLSGSLERERWRGGSGMSDGWWIVAAAA